MKVSEPELIRLLIIANRRVGFLRRPRFIAQRLSGQPWVAPSGLHGWPLRRIAARSRRLAGRRRPSTIVRSRTVRTVEGPAMNEPVDPNPNVHESGASPWP